MIFKDRKEAGVKLTEKLSDYKNKQAVVLGLTRGGVEVASVISTELNLPLEAIVVKKISSPLERELAVGAVTQDGVFYIDWKLALRLGAGEAYINSELQELKEEIKKLQQVYRAGRQRVNVDSRTVIVVDDGIATGATIRSVISWLKKKGAKKIIIAAPIAPPDFPNQVKPDVDELIILDLPKSFGAVGEFYKDFSEVDDKKVIKLLNTK